MIRRKLSSGVLRATKSSSSLRSTALAQAHASASVPAAQMQTAGLASATLLNSQRNWSKETVVTLKSELKKRGLSQTGNKSVLIDRLSSAEVSAMLPAMPSMPAKFSVASQSNFIRSLSTTASTAAKQRSRSSSQPTVPVTENAEQSTDEPVTTTGPDVISQRTEAPPTEEVAPETLSVAPGLPNTKATEQSKGQTLDLKMPMPAETEEIEQIIPVVPDNFEAKAVKEAEPKEEAPKVVTVAAATTHTAGGPTHASQETIDALSLEEAAEEAADKVSENMPSLTSALSSVITAPARAISSSGIASNLPEIGSARGFVEPEKEYKASDRKLNSEEKTGVWIFGGIVSLGLLLGGGKKKEKKHSVKETMQKAVGAGGVKGGPAWEKASGANIVGHGQRKD